MRDENIFELRVASYNIHGGIGADRHFVPNRIIDVLREIDADIVALQEVESRNTGFDMLEFLAAHLNMQSIPGPTLIADSGDYGNGILTRLPVLATHRIDLSIPGREARGAIDLKLNVVAPKQNMVAFQQNTAKSKLQIEAEQSAIASAGNSELTVCSKTQHCPIRVVATHLGLHPGERRTQVKKLLAIFESERNLPTIFLGDVNEWFLIGRPLRWLHRHFKRTPAPATFPAKFPLFALDRIWIHPVAALGSIYAHNSVLSRQASDHLPIVATLKIINVKL